MSRKRGHIIAIEAEGNSFLCTFEVTGPATVSGNPYCLKLPLAEDLVDKAVELLGAGPVEVVCQSGRIVDIEDTNQVESVDLETLVSPLSHDRRQALKRVVSKIVEEEKRLGDLSEESLYALLEREMRYDRAEAERMVNELILSGVLYIKGGKVGFPHSRYY